MSNIPTPTGREMVLFLERHDFSIVRIRGGHHVLKKGALRTTVPVHGTKTLKVGTFRGILRDIEMGPSQFAELWRQ